ncbi:hypothetical protein PIB30_053368 [Stylosanthes scabra]|uniref:Uncharacterized protein n=1 Tax=Stylosanthes scabra TaxID=79078 RepID=A0ABU6QHZ6_9FABA|nr:hypothetical protein [Stylosanthes scabra]
MVAHLTFSIAPSISVTSISLDGRDGARLGGSNNSGARRRQDGDVTTAQLLPSSCHGPSLSRHSILSSLATETAAPSPPGAVLFILPPLRFLLLRLHSPHSDSACVV